LSLEAEEEEEVSLSPLLLCLVRDDEKARLAAKLHCLQRQHCGEDDKEEEEEDANEEDASSDSFKALTNVTIASSN